MHISCMPKVHILVLNWNNYHDTKGCLQSLKNIKYSNVRIIVIDNNSSDGSGRRLLKEFPEYRFIFNSENLGYTGGNNVGITQSVGEKADYLLILNNDTLIPSPEFLSIAVDFMEENKAVGILGPQILSHETNKVLSVYSDSILFKRIFRHVSRENKGIMDLCKDGTVTPTVKGTVMLVRREVFEKIGLFDEHFFMYTDEDDFCIRAQLKGFKVIYYEKLIVYRKDGKDGLDYLRFKSYYVTRNLLRLVNKNFRGMAKAELLLIYLLFISRNLLKCLLKSETTVAAAVIKGFSDGARGLYGKRMCRTHG